MSAPYPHTPYLEAVADAFSRANMEPTSWEPLADEELGGVFRFGFDHPALETYSSWPDGAELVWGPTGWLLVDLTDRSWMDVRVDLYADPDRLVSLVRPTLVDGAEPPRTWDTSRWERADATETAVDAWNGESGGAR